MTLRRLKQLADIKVSNVDKKSVPGESSVRLCNYTDVYYNTDITPAVSFMAATATTNQIAAFGLRGGDVLITKDSETAEDIAVAAFVPHDLPGVLCGYHLALIRPRAGVDARFLYWTMASRPLREQFAAAATGVTRFGLRRDALGDVLVPRPPLATQRAIASYVDGEAARLDALVKKKRQLITLLDERFSTVVSFGYSR